MDAERVVVLHYHLFKNAGTSLDALLKQHFGAAWLTAEFPEDPRRNAEGVRSWIAGTPDARCYSSHTAELPPPEIPGVRIFPVIFARHPLDRIASTYAFEHTQNSASFGATLARNTTIGGYIETRLALTRDRQCRNFHTARFAAMFRGEPGTEIERALKAVDQLPFVGIVEAFDESLARLQTLLARAGFDGLHLEPVRHNVSAARSQNLDERLAALRGELGNDLYAKLEAANADDLALYEHARALV